MHLAACCAPRNARSGGKKFRDQGVGVQVGFEEPELLMVQFETRRLASYYLRVQLTTLIILGSVGGIYLLFSRFYEFSKFLTGLTFIVVGGVLMMK